MEQLHLWKYSDLAKFLCVSEDKLRRNVMNGEIPYIKVAGRTVRFDPAQIREWLAKNSIQVRG